MPEKKQGVKTTCNKCRTEIICGITNYTDYENKLQWQNNNGDAHYSFVNKKFICNIPITGDETVREGQFAPSMDSGNLEEIGGEFD